MSDENTTPLEYIESTALASSEKTDSTRESTTQIGPYRLLQKIGEGGMGEVWLAEQKKPLRRRVALKLVKLGMDTKQVIARFEAERQALALMDHPNVARVIDAGSTPQGSPYFAMEYVKGEAITRYCDKQRMTTKERLTLFTQVCEGVQHAHQKGIIHRDIKPSNVLVMVDGERVVPKIIDFGVAKAIEQRLTEKTVFTQFGTLVGTPEYMSPEQAEMTGLDIDTRTDVYSLGVLLYELLVGALPFDANELRRAGFDEIRRKIREDEPPKPSTRISGLGEASGEAAKQRRTDPHSLVQVLFGDLDWITMKALEKDRTRRYDSPTAFSADVQRHLRHEPVLASPPSAIYRLRKLVQRRRRMVLIGVALGAVTLAGIVAGNVAWRAQRAEDTQRVRWTLQEIIRTGQAPEQLEPDWSRLRGLLHEATRRDPAGPLADLALEAGATANVELTATFGLVSSPPSVAISAVPRLETGLDVIYLMQLEGSWDGGAWRPVGFETYRAGQTGGSVGVNLDSFVPESQLTPSPHRLALRGTFDVFDAASGLRPGRRGSGTFDHWDADVNRQLARKRIVRDLHVSTITLFDEYPAHFPRKQSLADLGSSLDSWFHPDRIRITRVSLPEGSGSHIKWGRVGQPAGAARTSPFGLLVQVEFIGRSVETMPIPIASKARVYMENHENHLLEFPFYFGKRVKGPGSGYSSMPGSDGSLSAFGIKPPFVPEVVADDIPDVTSRGVLRMLPSREVALNAARFDCYVAEEMSIPVIVELRTVPAQWWDPARPESPSD